ncbi:MAG: hypothetical protein OEW21_01845 [Betaproteobacteria bacterium]|nr:hypothetical protein [Betaproteobacteria bacterium]
MFKVGADFGGDKLATATFSNGQVQDIRANDGFFIGGGASILNDQRDLEAEISLTVKVDSIKASNGELVWSRTPIDALFFHRIPGARVGGGLTYHLGPELKGSGAAGNIFTKFDNALGVIAQGDYSISEQHQLGLRYTRLTYKTRGVTPQASAKSNGLGLVFSMRF